MNCQRLPWQRDAIWPKLTVSNQADQSGHWHGRVVGVFAVEALVTHESAEDASVGCEAGQ